MSKPEARWEVRLTRQAEKMLYRLPKKLLQRLDQAILALAENPYPAATEQLPGHDHLYRLHVAEWRIAYAVEVERLVVLIVEIASKQQPERYQLAEEADEGILPEEALPPEQFVTPLIGELLHRQFSSESWPTLRPQTISNPRDTCKIGLNSF
jgi:mRNA interferase RelE/StbE